MLNVDYPKVPSFFLIHGVVLWLVWSVVALIQIASNRYYKHYWRFNMWMHRIFGVIILYSTVFYGGYGYWKLGRVYDDGHAILGLATLAVILFLVLSGVIARSKLNRAI